MSGKSNRQRKFWQELKRRRVFKVVAMYAASAFIILEVVDIVAPSLGLPDWIMKLAIILLITGFPVTAVLSWIFDITPEGIKRTEALEELKKDEPLPDPARRKLRPGDVVIVVLLLIVGILAYPKIFSIDRFESIRDEDGRISIAVLPFENLTGDSTMDVFQKGISYLIIDGLVNSSQLAVRDDQSMLEVVENMDQFKTSTISSSTAQEAAQKLNAGTYITGNYQGMGDTYRILARMVDAQNGDIICTYQVEGNLNSSEYLDLADSLCSLITNYLEIRALEQEIEYDFRIAYSKSPEAYRYYAEGVNAIMRMEYDLASDLFKSALQIDTTFALAAYHVVTALTNKESEQNPEDWRKYTLIGYQLKEKLPYRYRLLLEITYASLISLDKDDLLKYCTLLENSDMDSRVMWFELGEIYSYDLQLYDKALKAYAQAERISIERDQPWEHAHFFRRYGQVLHLAGGHEKEKFINEEGLRLNPKYDRIIRNQAICAFSRGDTIEGKERLVRLSSVMKENGDTEATIERFIGRVFADSDLLDSAAIHFHRAYQLDPNDLMVIYYFSNFLIGSDIDMEEGMDIVDKGLSIDSEFADFNRLKGLALYKKGDYQEALVYSKKAVSNLNYYIAGFYQQVEMIEKALKESDKELE